MLKILYFSTVNWKWIKQRPHFISYYLSQQGHEVDFLSLNPFGKVVIEKFSIGQLNVVDSYVIPYSLKSRWVEKINIAFIQSQLLKKKYDVVILTNPLHHQYIPNCIKSQCTLIYECMDNMPYFYQGRLRERMFIEEQRTLNIVDGVITSSDKLTNELQRRTPNKNLIFQTIYNGIDQETFTKQPKTITLKQPNMLYIGTVSHWLDWDILDRFAAKNPQYTIYLIGPFEINKKLQPNMISVGSVPHHEVLDYIYSGNIMLLPFKVNELTEAVDPVKLYEYLSMDKPIISAYWSELEKFKSDNLKFYQKYQEFEEHAQKLNNKGFNSSLNETFIEQNNWEVRVHKYVNFLGEI